MNRQAQSSLLSLIITICFLSIQSIEYWNIRTNSLFFQYPYVEFDGFSWLIEGWSIATGIKTDLAFVRAPGLPIILAMLFQLKAESLFPFLAVALETTFFWLLYRLLKYFTTITASFITVFCFYCMSHLHLFFLHVRAEPWVITLQLYSILQLIENPGSIKRTVFSGFLIGLSWYFQHAIPVVLFFWIFLSLRKCSENDSGKTILAWFATFVVTIAPLHLYKAFVYGNPFYTKVVQFELLGAWVEGLLYYPYAMFVFMGPVFAVVALVGCCLMVYRSRQNLASHMKLFFVTGTVVNLVFWGVFYRWLELRFLLYFIPFLAIGFAAVIEKLIQLRRQFRVIVLFLLIYSGGVLAAISRPLSGIPFSINRVHLLPDISVNIPSKMIGPMAAIFPDLSMAEIVQNNASYLPLFDYFEYLSKNRNTIYSHAISMLQNDLSEIVRMGAMKNGDTLCARGELNIPDDFWYFAEVRRWEEKKLLFNPSKSSESRFHFFHPVFTHYIRHRIVSALGANLCSCVEPQQLSIIYSIESLDANVMPEDLVAIYRGQMITLAIKKAPEGRKS